LDHFVGAVLGTRCDAPNLLDGFQSLRVIDAAERSSLNRQSVSLPENDGWNTGYIIRKGSEGYWVISAGPDKKFGTNDDIVYPTLNVR
jgi:hypothetical protein